MPAADQFEAGYLTCAIDMQNGFRVVRRAGRVCAADETARAVGGVEGNIVVQCVRIGATLENVGARHAGNGRRGVEVRACRGSAAREMAIAAIHVGTDEIVGG